MHRGGSPHAHAEGKGKQNKKVLFIITSIHGSFAEREEESCMEYAFYVSFCFYLWATKVSSGSTLLAIARFSNHSLPQRTPKREDGKELLKVPNEQDCGKEIERKGKYIKMPSDKKEKVFLLAFFAGGRKSSASKEEISLIITRKRCVLSLHFSSFFRGTKEFTANNLICKV